MNLQSILKEINEFNYNRDWDQFHSPENLAKSITIESAELLECFQWTSEFDIKDVQEELADIFIYAFNLAQKLDLNIEEIIFKKIETNNMKYPVEKSRGNSTKYTEF